MAKKLSSSQKMASPEQIYFTIKSGIKVYPLSEFDYLEKKRSQSEKINYDIIQDEKWYIEVNNNGEILTFKKKVSQNELNDAIAKTIIYYYNKLKEKL